LLAAFTVAVFGRLYGFCSGIEVLIFTDSLNLDRLSLPHVFLCDDFLLAQVWKGAEEQRNWRKRCRGIDHP
jgi:hypothetical protein